MPKFRRERSEKILSECEACGHTAMGTFTTGEEEEAQPIVLLLFVSFYVILVHWVPEFIR